MFKCAVNMSLLVTFCLMTEVLLFNRHHQHDQQISALDRNEVWLEINPFLNECRAEWQGGKLKSMAGRLFPSQG